MHGAGGSSRLVYWTAKSRRRKSAAKRADLPARTGALPRVSGQYQRFVGRGKGSVQDRIKIADARPEAGSCSGHAGTDRALIALLLGVHVVCWTIYGTFALGVGALHDDVIEAWNWAQSPQLGYYKHPPLFAWVTWAWFQVCPIADWSFYLLASCWAAIGLAGTAALARFAGCERDRVSAISFLMVSPLYGFLALKFNANAVLIAVWPWASYWFLRSLVSGRAVDGAIAGALAALAMLGKYYSALLLVAFLAAALLPEHRRRYFGSPAPYVSMLVGALVLSPHIWWTVANNFPTVEYALSKFRYPFVKQLYWAAMTALAPLILLSPAVVATAWAARISPRALLGRARVRCLSPEGRALAIIGCLPFLLTLAFGLAGRAKVSLSYTIPIFFLAPLPFLAPLDAGVAARVRARLLAAGLALTAGVAVASPLVGILRVRSDVEIAVMPLAELGTEATRIWREATGRALRIVGSSSRLVGAISFYSPDHPLYFIDFDSERAPWVTDRRIAREGMLVVCRVGDERCAREVVGLGRKDATTRRVRLERSLFGHRGPAAEFDLTVLPPTP